MAEGLYSLIGPWAGGAGSDDIIQTGSDGGFASIAFWMHGGFTVGTGGGGLAGNQGHRKLLEGTPGVRCNVGGVNGI